MITKTVFLDYLHCPEAAWLHRNHPDAVIWPVPTAFDRLTIRDGQAVERLHRHQVASREGHAHEFQVVFEAGGFHARADAIRHAPGGSLDIVEVKASTSHRKHLVDICFQRIVAERSGARVRRCIIAHVDPAFRHHDGESLDGLLTYVDVSDEVDAMRADIEATMLEAKEFLARGSAPADGCSCRARRGRRGHCAAFRHFNPDLDGPTAHDLPRISPGRLARLHGEGRLPIPVVEESDVTPAQLPALRAMKSRRPIIDRPALSGFLDRLVWPLHFYDYETFASAVPMALGHGPYRQLPVQFSLHVMRADGRIEHHEHISEDHGMQGGLVDAMREAFESSGSAIVWNQSFEIGCNRRMIDLVPSAETFLLDVNARKVDLMQPFVADFVHPDFAGSTSIKRVLPVLCPDLGYHDLDIRDGAAAMEGWLRMVEARGAERTRLRAQLLAYCRMDTWAMVRILQAIQDIVAGDV